MLTWRDIVLYGLSKEYPIDIVSQIVYFLYRESIHQSALESRNYHVDRIPRVIKKPFEFSDDFYHIFEYNYELKNTIALQERLKRELLDKWLTINPKDKEYTYMDIWRWDRFSYPYMEFVYAFNRGRIFLRFLKGYAWYDLNDENNIVDKLTDYEEIK